jgi:hypothetical protein
MAEAKIAEDENLFKDIEEEKKQDGENISEELTKQAEETEEENEDSVFDYNDLPDAPAQKYERVLLDGKTVTIKSAVIEKPGADVEWKKTLNGNAFFKPYSFRIDFDTENNDREYLSGLKGFKQDNGSLSNPTMFLAGKNQIAKLFKVYKAHIMKTQEIEEKDFDEKYGLKKFMAFLNSSPKAKLKVETIEFQGKDYKKNVVEAFV